MSADDVLAIQRLVADYADAVCRRDGAAWAALWTPDCRWDLGRGRRTEGREATVALWHSASARYPWVAQVVTGCLVDVDGDSATARTYILEMNHRLDGSGALHLGHYSDSFRRLDGRWLIAERRFHMIYRGPLDPGVVVPLGPLAASGR